MRNAIAASESASPGTGPLDRPHAGELRAVKSCRTSKLTPAGRRVELHAIVGVERDVDDAQELWLPRSDRFASDNEVSVGHPRSRCVELGYRITFTDRLRLYSQRRALH